MEKAEMEQYLERFVQAQEGDYEIALQEMKDGEKRSHWMWYIFPQIAGLGFSPMAKRYAIPDLETAKAYVQHPLLGRRLLEISEVLLKNPSNDPFWVMGSPDDLKLRSSMTLFAIAAPKKAVFQRVLDKFYGGEQDGKTIQILKRQG